MKEIDLDYMWSLFNGLVSDDDGAREAAAKRLLAIEAEAKGSDDDGGDGGWAHLVRRVLTEKPELGKHYLRRLVRMLAWRWRSSSRMYSPGEGGPEGELALVAGPLVIGSAGRYADELIDEMRSWLRDPVRVQLGQDELAAERLGAIGPAAKQAVEDLLADILENGVWHWPSGRCWALARIVPDDEAVIGRLAEALSSSKEKVRQGVATALGMYGTAAAAAIPALSAATHHEESTTRSAAASALGEVGQGRDDVAEHLIALAQNDPAWEVRAVALYALGRIGRQAERVVPLLVAGLSDQRRCADLAVRAEAAQALAMFGEKAAGAVGALVDELVDAEGYVDPDIVEALRGIGAPALTAIPALKKALPAALDEEDKALVRQAIRDIRAAAE